MMGKPMDKDVVAVTIGDGSDEKHDKRSGVTPGPKSIGDPDGKPRCVHLLKRHAILFTCVGLLIAMLAVGVLVSGIGSSADGADDPAVEVDVFIDIESESHRAYTPLPNHTFSQLAAAAVGSTAKLNVVVSAGNLSEPTTISHELKIAQKRQEGRRRLSDDAAAQTNGSASPLSPGSQPVDGDNKNVTRLLVFQAVNEDHEEVAIPILGKNITSVSCVVSVEDDTLSMCEYHDSEQHLARRLLSPRVVIFGALLIIVLGTLFRAIPLIERKGCFPGSALVSTPNGTKRMSALQVSDLVLTHEGYSPVYLFGHQDAVARSEMVQINTDSNQSLSLTADHYVPFANGTFAAARHVQEGDAVWVRGRVGEMVQAVVTKIGRVIEIGLYNPYPYVGTIVVNGILASAHSSWLLEGMLPETHIPAAYDALLTPVQILHRLFPGWLERFAMHVAGAGSLDEKGVAGIAHAAMMAVLQ